MASPHKWTKFELETLVHVASGKQYHNSEDKTLFPVAWNFAVHRNNKADYLDPGIIWSKWNEIMDERSVFREMLERYDRSVPRKVLMQVFHRAMKIQDTSRHGLVVNVIRAERVREGERIAAGFGGYKKFQKRQDTENDKQVIKHKLDHANAKLKSGGTGRHVGTNSDKDCDKIEGKGPETGGDTVHAPLILEPQVNGVTVASKTGPKDNVLPPVHKFFLASLAKGNTKTKRGSKKTTKDSTKAIKSGRVVKEYREPDDNATIRAAAKPLSDW